IRRRDAELAIKLREAVLEEQQLAAKAARFQSLQEPTPPDISSGLELARFRKTTLESNIEHLQANLVATRGDFHRVRAARSLGLSSLDLVDPSSGALQKLASNPRKKATGLLRVGNTYEAARLEKNSTGAPASTPVMFSLSTAVTSQTPPP
ncbi:unnamed protein product, partial [Scytosiphon promiscuus]